MVTGVLTAECMALPDGYTLLSECSQNAYACPHDTFCMDTEECLGITDWGHRCSVGVPHGYHCDSDWDDPGCAPCMPGTECVGAAGNKRCRMKCEDSGDCPCGDTGAVNGCNPDDGLCYRCRATGYTCNENTLCCDEDTICGPISGVCCNDLGTECDSDDKCCPEHICHSNGKCSECVPDLGPCTDSHDCCSELCLNGECREDCTGEAGKPCPVSGKQGECKKGVITCIDYVEACAQIHDPVPETCDDKDNDCDGQTDEGLQSYGSCSTAHPYECQSGFTTTGKKSCEDGDEVCKATIGVDYCNACDDPAQPNCGWCTTNPAQCSSNSQCAPGARCMYDSSYG